MSIEVIAQESEQPLAIPDSGKLTDDDHDEVRLELELRADRFDSFDLLVDLSQLVDLEPSVIRRELEFATDCTNRRRSRRAPVPVE